jgi:hypothetical protein
MPRKRFMPPPGPAQSEKAGSNWRVRCNAAPRNHPNAPVLLVAHSVQFRVPSKLQFPSANLDRSCSHAKFRDRADVDLDRRSVFLTDLRLRRLAEHVVKGQLESLHGDVRILAVKLLFPQLR